VEIDRNKYLALTNETYFDCLGRVTKVVGLTIESVGPDAKLNDLCRIFVGGDRSQAVMAQVVGFRDKHLLLTPFDSVDGIGIGAVVENTKAPLSIPVGDELLGHRTTDGCRGPLSAPALSGRRNAAGAYEP